jgi:nicotinamide-nucleotide amidase
MKTRETISTRKIALLATGDEICNGDILNSNSQEIAQRLVNLGMHVGMHAVTSDNIAEIEKAISFLLTSHQAVIITGGLGPTSDDLTRYAVCQALNRPLIFDEATWNSIVERLKQFGYPTPPESNRQQALFPEQATIIPNPNGTAAGCITKHENQFICMLPGPPSECLPMIDSIVIPTLIEHHFQQIAYHKSWMLFGVSEGQIAEELDALANQYDCVTGYRIFYPYIEFKIHSSNEQDFIELSRLIDKTVAMNLISEGRETASDMLKKTLENLNFKICISDSATGGLLEYILKTPGTISHLSFSNNQPLSADMPTFILSGLHEFWQQEHTKVKTPVELNYYFQGKHKRLTAEAPHRGERVKRFAAEWACYEINKLLGQIVI